MLNLEKGMDEIYWGVTGGKATLEKVTRTYHEMDLEELLVNARSSMRRTKP